MTLRRTSGVLAMAAALAASCTPASTPSTTSQPVTSTGAPAVTTTTTAGPQTSFTTTTHPARPRGGKIVVGTDQEPPTLNPLAPGGDTTIVRALAALYAPGAFGVGWDLGLVPVLAWLPMADAGDLTIGDEGTLTVRWRINEDAVWSDGAPVTGDDFAFTLTLPGVTDGLPPIERVAASAKAIEVEFAEPTLGYDTLFEVVVPRHVVEGSEFELDWNTEMWPSAGPFVFEEWRHGEYLRLRRNDRFWVLAPGEEPPRPLPYLDGIEIVFFPETAQLVEALVARRIDLALLPDPMDAATVAARSEATVSLVPGLIWEQLGFSFLSDDALLDHRELRRAVALAVDRDRLAAEWSGLASSYRMDGFVESQRSIPQGPWSRYPFDPDAARTAIAALCGEVACPEGALVTISVSGTNDARVRLVESIVSMLGEAGIRAETSVWNVIDADWWQFRWEAGAWAWATRPGATDLVAMLARFDPGLEPGISGSFQGWGTPGTAAAGTDPVARFAGLLDEMRKSFDREAVKRLAVEAEAILAEEVVLIPLFRRPVATAYWRDTLGAYRSHPDPARVFESAWHWYRADR